VEGQGFVTADDGCRLWTEAAGAGSPMVLCHGGPGLWDYLSPLARLIGDGYRVHRYDQRAGGRSGRERPWTLDRFVRDLDAVRAHFGYERWLVGGHSFGADLALRYACAYPERTIAVVYLAGVGIAWTAYRAAFGEAVTARRPADDERRYRELSDRDRTDAEEREFRILSWTTDYVDPAVGKANAAGMADTGMPVNYELNRILGAESKTESATARADMCRGMSARTLVVQGEDDPRPVASCDSLVEALPSVRRVVIPDAGHLPWVERPVKFTAVVRDFLAEEAAP
jgi:proline iminopeptidase